MHSNLQNNEAVIYISITKTLSNKANKNKSNQNTEHCSVNMAAYDGFVLFLTSLIFPRYSSCINRYKKMRKHHQLSATDISTNIFCTNICNISAQNFDSVCDSFSTVTYRVTTVVTVLTCSDNYLNSSEETSHSALADVVHKTVAVRQQTQCICNRL